MIEIDVDMGYLLDEGGNPGAVVLNDENGDYGPMRFVRERTCMKLSPLVEQTCIVRRGGCEMEFGYWRCSECQCENFEGARYCQYCGAKAEPDGYCAWGEKTVERDE